MQKSSSVRGMGLQYSIKSDTTLPTTLHLFSTFTPVYYISTIWYHSAYTSNAQIKEKKKKSKKVKSLKENSWRQDMDAKQLHILKKVKRK